MRLVADAGERCELVSLSACRKDDEPFRRILIHVLDGDDGVIFVFDDTYFPRYLDVGAHTASVDDDFFAVLLGKMHDADEPLQVGSEHRDNKPAF